VANSGGSVTSSVALLSVVDTTAPVLSLSANIVVTRTSAGGAAVAYSASAADTCAGAVAVACLPPSGSVFPLGVTPVNCRADDGQGNTNSGSFTVTVEPPAAPMLHVQMVETSIALTWPKSAGSFRLLSSLELAPGANPTTWQVVTEPKEDAGANWKVLVPTSGPAKFFRLQEHY